MIPYRLTLKSNLPQVIDERTSEGLAELAEMASLYSPYRFGASNKSTSNSAAITDLLAIDSEIIQLNLVLVLGSENIKSTNLLETIEQNLRKEGIVWTRLVDIIVEKGLWTEESGIAGRTPLKQWLAQLTSWIQDSSFSEVAKMFHAFKALPLRKSLICNVDLEGKKEEDLLQLGGNDVKYASYFFENPKLTLEQGVSIVKGLYNETATTKERVQIIRAAIEKFNGLDNPTWSKIVNKIGEGVQLDIQNRRGHSHYGEYRGVQEMSDVVPLLLADPDINSDILEQIAQENGITPPTRVRALFHPSVSEIRRDEIIKGYGDKVYHSTLKTILQEVPDAPSKYVVPLVHGNLGDYELIKLMDHKGATKEVWQKAVGNMNREVRAALARSPLAAEPEVRRELIGSTAMDVMTGLLKTATAEEWAALFYRVLRKDSDTALAFLAKNDPPAGTKLPAGWIKKFMMSGDSSVREKAAKCLRKCQGGVGASAPPPDRAPRLKRG